MKPMIVSFKQFILQIWSDSMLAVICILPAIIGIFFKFGIPIAEIFLCEYFDKLAILSPYYLLFDICLAVITPYMFCFSSAMVILEEKDTNITNYISVTPIGKSGYLLSRLAFPTIISIVVSVIMLLLFSLTETSVLVAAVLSISTAPIGIIIALMIVSLSSNKVEGIAIAKLGGIIMFGVAIPFFITDVKQYLGAFLPSFWIGKFMLDFGAFNLIIAVVVAAIWICLLSKRFNQKIN
ncbi:ABC transporter permease [Anaerocolumna sp. AGMB13020]|uniref:ABC transporter permease n=1 Tax=Anaerocolumna sp. AGMB13020 TaxID=3081750 RepID=UPI00295527FD|nr:ABC transporter permease [Anaerocolumna sp. AGMB13020]WOO37672.1 ABC transporter permease [Anaerocolumna sp. AGMB13020]